jgi:hypothetical protein
MKFKTLVVIFFALYGLNVVAQQDTIINIINDFNYDYVDSIPVFLPQQQDDEFVVITDTLDLSTVLPTWTVEEYTAHSPAKAAMLSAVMPGLGQIYNEKYWKVPVIYAGVGVSVGVFLHWQNQFSKYRRAYITINDKDPNTNYHDTLGFPPTWREDQKTQYITRHKDIFRSYRDWSIVAMVLVYALNIIDANVDAHLKFFNVDDDISLNIQPIFFQNGMDSQNFGLSLRLSF